MDDLKFFIGIWHAEAEDPTSGQTFTLRYEVEPVFGRARLEGLGESQSFDTTSSIQSRYVDTLA